MNVTKIAVITFGIVAVSLSVVDLRLSTEVFSKDKNDAGNITAETTCAAPEITYAGINEEGTGKDLLKLERGLIAFRNNIPKPGIVFRIQVFSSKNPVSVLSSSFKGLYDVKEYHYNGMYKYTVGEFKLPKQSNQLFEDLEQKGYHNSFMVAFKDDKPMKVADAMKAVMKL